LNLTHFCYAGKQRGKLNEQQQRDAGLAGDVFSQVAKAPYGGKGALPIHASHAHRLILG
jgi:hypothetical protein